MNTTTTKQYLSGLLQPWRLGLLFVGLSTLIIGGRIERAPDWDDGISWIMGLFAYATAPTAIRLLEKVAKTAWQQHQFAWKPLMFSLGLFYLGVDGLYYLYWSYFDPWALEQMRSANAFASVFLYALAGYVWKPNGTLCDGLRATSAALGLRPRATR
jgi:hypothetical protein